MKERPMIFTGPSVRAIRDGRKTQTRRLVKPQPTPIPEGDLHGRPPGSVWWPSAKCRTMVDPRDMGGIGPYGWKHDRLWVKETYRLGDGMDREDDPSKPTYAADWPDAAVRWKTPLFMPRKYSRLLLEITTIRVERVQDITEEDARAEGVDGTAAIPAMINGKPGTVHCFGPDAARKAYALTWDGIHARGEKASTWLANPFVWAITFRVVEGLRAEEVA